MMPDLKASAMLPRLFLILFALLVSLSARADVITLGSTTSAYDSGLLDELKAAFEADTDHQLKLVINGTGQTLMLARRGDLDAAIVHDKESELAVIGTGAVTGRTEFMYNDFVIVGPAEDPAAVRGLPVTAALHRLSEAGVPFASRGDDSGTHKAELRLWASAGLEPADFTPRWYRKLGSGMGATLNAASAMNAYTLTDRGTWLAFQNRGTFEILVEGDPPLRNVYSFLPVSPDRFDHVPAQAVQELQRWLTAPRGQAVINGFRMRDQQLFFGLYIP